MSAVGQKRTFAPNKINSHLISESQFLKTQNIDWDKYHELKIRFFSDIYNVLAFMFCLKQQRADTLLALKMKARILPNETVNIPMKNKIKKCFDKRNAIMGGRA